MQLPDGSCEPTEEDAKVRAGHGSAPTGSDPPGPAPRASQAR